MKKNVLIASIFLFFSLFANAHATLAPPSTSAVVGSLFQWMLLITTSILVLVVIILGIKHFSRKDVEKKVPTNSSIIAKLAIPYTLFFGIFVFSKHQIGGYSCIGCFANVYEKIVVDITAAIFFMGSILMAFLMKKTIKNGKFYTHL